MENRLPRDVLGVFVKAPITGQVKTRLAAEVGAVPAAEVYRVLGRRVVSTSVGAGYDTVVWFTPAEARQAVRDWLQGLGVAAFRAQAPGGLGARMATAFRHHFREQAQRVILIGSDCPGVDSDLVSAALTALDRHDLVVGPANDGGYYLIGLRGVVPQLFRGIAWSTELVFDQTLARAHKLGFRPALLPTLRDVDTASDARAAGLLPAMDISATTEAPPLSPGAPIARCSQ
jgi:rSAM/selenodomain-associated transferase 1